MLPITTILKHVYNINKIGNSHLDMQPFKAMRDFARRTGGEDSGNSPDTSTVSKETT